MTLDDFMIELLDDHEPTISDAIDEMASRRQRPPTSPEQLIEILHHYVPGTVEWLRRSASELELVVALEFDHAGQLHREPSASSLLELDGRGPCHKATYEQNQPGVEVLPERREFERLVETHLLVR